MEVVETENKYKSLKESVICKINSIFIDDSYGFEMLILAKTEPVLRAMHLDDRFDSSLSNDRLSFKTRVGLCIKNAIIGKFIGFDDQEKIEKQYDDGTNLADNQHKIYVLKQCEGFNPFGVLNEAEYRNDDFKQESIGDIKGFLFRFARGKEIIWGYQHYYGITVSKNKNNGLRGILSRFEDSDVFTEFKELMITIPGKVDILIDGEKIITDQIQLLQKHFGFEQYINVVTSSTIKAIEKLDVVENIDKVSDYVSRGKSNAYKKKVMRISNSKVLNHSQNEILKNIEETERWKGIFKINGNKIVLETYKDVEHLIDLLDERYTVSQITGEEYDTDVKKPAEPRTY